MKTISNIDTEYVFVYHLIRSEEHFEFYPSAVVIIDLVYNIHNVIIALRKKPFKKKLIIIPTSQTFGVVVELRCEHAHFRK